MVSPEAKAPGRIDTESVDGVFHIRISNAARVNAMSLAMWEELARVAAVADDDPDVRVIVLSGEGRKAFASGADISEFAARLDDPGQQARFGAALRAAQHALSESRHPTVAVIRGVCMGGGMALAVACDLRYCTRHARFRMPAGQLGVGYDPDGIRRFVNTVGASRTAELFLTARTFDGHEAARIGLVHESFDDEIFDVMTTKRIRAISRLAPLSLRAAKLALRHVLNEPGAPDINVVNRAVEACHLSQDHQEGQEAFLGKREPKFLGR